MRGLIAALLLLTGCPERTTGEPMPLDPRFFASAPEGGSVGGSPNDVAHSDAAHHQVAHHDVAHTEGAKPGGPFDGYAGETVPVRGLITGGDAAQAVEMDFRAPDPESEGGFSQLGKVFLDAPGAFSIEAPVGFGAMTIEAFQDPDGDGPSELDPFAALSIEVADVPAMGLVLALEEGGRLKVNAAAGAQAQSPFKDHDGPWTTLTGTISGGNEGLVALDMRVPAPKSPTGDKYVGKAVLAGAGAYTLQVPRGLGELVVEAFQDQAGDGPDPTDPYQRQTITVGDAAQQTVDFVLQVGAYVRDPKAEGLEPAPDGAPGGAPQGGGLNPDAPPLFSALGDDPITVSGAVVAEGVDAETIDLDIFLSDPDAPGGRRYLGKLKTTPGPFSFQAPRNAGSLEIEAFVDVDGDGPTPGDPFGACDCNPLALKGRDISGITLTLKGGAQ
ncbi:MAG: hypothetical protein H6739_09770 [Alphaproteobacteria bacterium]|nr:hypothetical protein [Alphaproteobacteria bacterium]